MNSIAMLKSWYEILKTASQKGEYEAMPMLMKHCANLFQSWEEYHGLRHFDTMSRHLKTMSEDEIEQTMKRIQITLKRLGSKKWTL